MLATEKSTQVQHRGKLMVFRQQPVLTAMARAFSSPATTPAALAALAFARQLLGVNVGSKGPAKTMGREAGTVNRGKRAEARSRHELGDHQTNSLFNCLGDVVDQSHKRRQCQTDWAAIVERCSQEDHGGP